MPLRTAARWTVFFTALAACAEDSKPGKPLPTRHDSIVVRESSVEPSLDRRNGEIYRGTLFSRDDQVFHTLDAGINAGQHEGGGKSLEIRRFGFNLDHGGVSGGLKVLVDGVQQNLPTQGHGQGYLGNLKSLTPELIQEVNLINGPFSPEYGDFSGLGVVHIQLRDSMPDLLTTRFQRGNFDSTRGFLAISPEVRDGDALLAYEGSYSHGPFLNPLRYRRDNVTSSFLRRPSSTRQYGLKMNYGRNGSFSSGQLPLDQIDAGLLHRFGFLDPSQGIRAWNGTAAAYYRQEGPAGQVWKIDGFLARSLFDLYSNFTYFLADPENGDAIQQHDSRLQQGVNAQYLRPHRLFGAQAYLSSGANFHANQVNVGLYPRVDRVPLGVTTRANAGIVNGAGYIQENAVFLQGRLLLGGGLRYDAFRFAVRDRVHPELSGAQASARFQPKASLAFTPSFRLPLTLHLNYGRGISTSDARAVVNRPGMPRIANTDFSQAGLTHRFGRLSLSESVFFIARSNEQVYIPDDGTIEFRGPSRSYGFEFKTSADLTRRLSLNASLTRVSNAFYRGASPRLYVDSAPKLVANAGLTLTAWRGWSGSFRMRAIDSYRLDGEDASIRAAGHTVFDCAVNRRLTRWADFQLAVDNLLNRSYYETQNYFESRLPGQPRASRIHATPGYSRTFVAGLTFRFRGK